MEQQKSSCQNALSRSIDLPARLRLSASPMEKQLLVLEETDLLAYDRLDLYRQLVDCITHEHEAELEVQYFCLHLAQTHGYQREQMEFNRLIEALNVVGSILIRLLREHQLYRNGRLPYRIATVSGLGIDMLRQDLFFKELANEFRSPRF